MGFRVFGLGSLGQNPPSTLHWRNIAASRRSEAGLGGEFGVWGFGLRAWSLSFGA